METPYSDEDTSEIQLDSNSSNIDYFYVRHRLMIISGKGRGLFSTIVKYDGKRKIATVEPRFLEQPDESSRFVIIRC